MVQLTMYATHHCLFCQQAIAWLAEHPEFTAVVEVQFVDTDRIAYDEFAAQDFRGVPAFVTDRERWTGWDPERLVQVLARHEHGGAQIL